MKELPKHVYKDRDQARFFGAKFKIVTGRLGLGGKYREFYFRTEAGAKAYQAGELKGVGAITKLE